MITSSRTKSKVVILLTDGIQNAGSLPPQKAAELAHSFGIKVYTVGAGTRGEAPFLVDTLFGPDVQMQSVPIDDKALTQVAKTTGGMYFRAEDQAALAQVYDQIDQLEKTKIESNHHMEYDERFSWFVVPSVVLVLIELLLLGTRLRKLP